MDEPSFAADTPLTAVEFLAFDTETTGCAGQSSRMVEIGAVRFAVDGRELARFTRLINPLRPIPARVVAVHGITDADVRNAPPEADVLPEFLTFLGDPQRTIAMAHNAAFDLSFIGAALHRCGLPAPPHAIIDTVGLSRRRAAGLPSHALAALVRTFGIGEATEHRGLSDSLALQQVFLNLVARPPALRTLGELFRCARPRQMQAAQARTRRPGRRPNAPAPPPPVGQHDQAATGHGLATAIDAGRTVSLIYDGGSSTGTRRRVTPLQLIVGHQVTYLLAFCHLDRKQKQYRLDRIREWFLE